jgi:predicted metal-binding protein
MSVDKYEIYRKRALEMGIPQAMVIDASAVVVEDWVRLKCQYGCGGYAKYLSCPPFSPTPETMRKVISSYAKGLLLIFDNISHAQDRDDSVSLSLRESVFQLERDMFLDGFYKAFGMGSGPCHFCETCDTTVRCRFPEKVRPSMEACGIDVYQTLGNCGITLKVVRSYDEQCTYAGLILIE